MDMNVLGFATLMLFLLSALYTLLAMCKGCRSIIKEERDFEAFCNGLAVGDKFVEKDEFLFLDPFEGQDLDTDVLEILDIRENIHGDKWVLVKMHKDGFDWDDRMSAEVLYQYYSKKEN